MLAPDSIPFVFILLDQPSLISFGTRLKYLRDMNVMIIAASKKLTEMGRVKKIKGPPIDNDWRRACSNIAPKIKPRTSGAIGQLVFRMT